MPRTMGVGAAGSSFTRALSQSRAVGLWGVRTYDLRIMSVQTDPPVPVPVPAGLVVDIVWWLDSCDDEEVDPDSAVKLMESVAWVMDNLPTDQQQRLIEVLGELADAEQDPARAQQLRSFPFDCGLVEDDPNTDEAEGR